MAGLDAAGIAARLGVRRRYASTRSKTAGSRQILDEVDLVASATLSSDVVDAEVVATASNQFEGRRQTDIRIATTSPNHLRRRSLLPTRPKKLFAASSAVQELRCQELRLLNPVCHAFLAGDGKPDPELDYLSTVPTSTAIVSRPS